MSCCSGCDSGWGDCGSGMAGLMGALLAPGSQVRVGFAYNYESTPAGVEAERKGAGWLQQAISQQLQALGVFSSVSVAIQQPQYMNFQDGYITIQVTAGDGQSDPENVGDMAQYAISAYAPGIAIIYRDFTRIDYVPPSEVGKSGVAQVTTVQQNQNVVTQSGACNWDTMSFGDYVACQVGITSPIGGIGAGAIGGIAAAGLLALVAIVVLKRF